MMTVSAMPFSYTSKKTQKTYFLHMRTQTSNVGKTTKLYYFAGTPGERAIDDLPTGFKVYENERTGLPFLRKDQVDS